MANTVSNLLYISGCLTDRDQLVGGIARAGGSRALIDAHVSPAWMALGASKPYAGGYIYDVAPSHTDGYTAFRFHSRGDAQYTWLESAAAVFPGLTFELLVGSVMQFVAYTRYEQGRKVVDELEPDYRAVAFCAKHGWDGWWTPVWDESFDSPEGLPSVKDVEDADNGVPTLSDIEGAATGTDSLPVDLPATLVFPPTGTREGRDTDYPVQEW